MATQRVSAREARQKLAEITDRVSYTGEPVILEKHGRPFAAIVSIEDLEAVERVRANEYADEFARRLARTAATSGPPPSEDEITIAVKKTREELYREMYGEP
jgi:prevent-host-death family protein